MTFSLLLTWKLNLFFAYNLFQKGIYIRHKNFFDFREVADIYPNVTNPIYMNFVRHPIERFLSFYHYLRMPSSQVSLAKQLAVRDMNINWDVILQFKMEDNAIIFSPTLGLFRMRTSYEECFWVLTFVLCFKIKIYGVTSLEARFFISL